MIKVLKKTFDVLEYVTGQEERAVLPAEIESALNLPHATVARVLKDLSGLGYLEQTGARKGYVSGPLAFELGHGRRYRNGFVEFADPLIKECAEKLGESLLFCVLCNDWRLILIQYNYNPSFQVLNHAVRIRDLYQTVSGRVLLAHSPTEKRKAVISSYGLPVERQWKEGSGSLKKMDSAFDRIRNDGFAEQKVSMCGNFHIFACPVFQNGSFLGALAANWEPDASGEFSARCRKTVLELAQVLSSGRQPKISMG